MISKVSKVLLCGLLISSAILCEAQTSANFDQIVERAKSGDPASMNLLGNIYANGNTNLNIQKDLNEAKKWFEQGVSKNYPSSYFNLGLIYERGEVVAKDQVKANELFKKSAELGNKAAQTKLEKLGIPFEVTTQRQAQESPNMNSTQSRGAVESHPTNVRSVSQPITAFRVYKVVETKDGGRFEQVGSNAICIFDPKSEELTFRVYLGYLGSKEVSQWIAQQDRLENNNNQTDRWSHIRVGKEIFTDMNKFYKTCRYYVTSSDAKSMKDFAIEQEKYLRINPWSSIAVGRPISVGPTLDASLSRQAYAANNGYQNWEEVQLSILAGGPDGDKETVAALNRSGINTVKDYQDTVTRMNNTNYSNETKPSLAIVTGFVKDEQEARKKGISVLAMKAEKDKKELAAKQAQDAKAESERKARQDARAKEFPYEAVLTCGMPDHINILACFAKSGYGADTELTLKNGNSTNMYKAYNLLSAGVEQRDGFHIDLRPGSALMAQNAHKTLILGLKVYDRKTGKLVMGNQVAQYGIVTFKGQ